MVISVYGVSLGANKPFVDEEMDSRSHFPTSLPNGARQDHCLASVFVNIMQHSCYTVQM